MIFLIIWILGLALTVFGSLFMQGRNDKRLADEHYISSIPWFVGVGLCWAWPVLLPLAALAFAGHAAYGLGAKRGIAFNQEVRVHRKFMREFNENYAQTVLAIEAKGVDPNSLDPQTVKELNAQSVAWAMTKEQGARNDEARQHVRLAIENSKPGIPDPVFAEILDRNNVVIPRASELDLTS